MTFVAVPDKNAGDPFTQTMWATYIEANLNSGVERPLWDSGVLGAAAASINITSIPATFASLFAVVHGRGDTALTAISVGMRLNNDSGANYYSERLRGNGATASAAETLASTSFAAGSLPAASAVAGFGGSVLIWIPAYATTTFTKGLTALSSAPTGTTTGTLFGDFTIGVWNNNAAAINQITLTPSAGNFATGSRVTLYGMGYI